VHLFRNKKGLSVAAIIGGIVAFLVLLSVYNTLFAATTNTIDQEMRCRQLIGAKKLSKDSTNGAINLFTEQCVTIKKTIPDNHKVSNSEQIKKLFADEIKKSWWMVHEGSLDAMWDDDTWRILDAPEKCIILKSILYQGDGKLYSINKSDFKQFLLSKIAKEDDLGNQWTYYQYVQNYGSNPASLILVPDSTTVKNLKDYPSFAVYSYVFNFETGGVISSIVDNAATIVSGDEIFVENYLLPGARYAIAVKSGGGRLTLAEGNKNTLYFGLERDIENMGCVYSVPDED